MEGNELWGPIQEPEAAYECYPSTNNYKRGKHDAGLQQCCVINAKMTNITLFPAFLANKTQLYVQITYELINFYMSDVTIC